MLNLDRVHPNFVMFIYLKHVLQEDELLAAHQYDSTDGKVIYVGNPAESSEHKMKVFFHEKICFLLTKGNTEIVAKI